MTPVNSRVPRNTPELGNSEAGFVILVVFLSVIIIASCTAVFFLLRNHSPSEGERKHRQRLRTYHRSRTTSFGSMLPFMGNNDPSRGHANESSWVEKLKVILPGGHSARGGWTQTPGGDEWEDRSDDGSYHLSEPQSGRPVSYVSQDPPFSPPMQASDSSQTVRLEAFHPSDAGVDRTASLNVESPSHPERTIMREPPATYQQNQKPPSPPLIGAFRRENSDAYEEAMPTQIFQSQPPRRPNFPVRPQSAIIEEATVSEPETESPKASMDKTIPAFEGGTKFVESLS